MKELKCWDKVIIKSAPSIACDGYDGRSLTRIGHEYVGTEATVFFPQSFYTMKKKFSLKKMRFIYQKKLAGQEVMLILHDEKGGFLYYTGKELEATNDKEKE